MLINLATMNRSKWIKFIQLNQIRKKKIVDLTGRLIGSYHSDSEKHTFTH